LRAAIVFGPIEVRRNKVVRYVNDKYTDQFYRLGEKEHFVLSRMDGSRTLPEIAKLYAAEYGKQLGPAAWQGLFKLLHTRHMLEADADLSQLDALKEETQTKRGESSRWYMRRFRLVNPDRVLERLLDGGARFLFSPGFIVPALLAILCIEALVFLNFKAISAETWTFGRALAVWPVCVALFWVSAVLHETAHGLTCKYFGGRVTDMGIIWRYLWFSPYCKLDHVVLFHKRAHRIYVFLAGTFVSLLFLIPFAVMWWTLPPTNIWHTISARMLFIFNFSALLNLMPFVQLDGYFVLTSVFGMSDLRKEAHVFFKKVLFNQSGWDEEYSRKEKCVYSVYGPLSLLMTIAIVLMMISVWFLLLSVKLGLGPLIAALILLTVFSALTVMNLRRRWKHKQPRADAEPARQIEVTGASLVV
jgi:putative peptide zinc metalloprotease protein